MSSQKTTFTRIQKWTLFSTILASSLAFIDSIALNVALPALQKDLNISGTELLWVINSYALFMSALLLVGGSLGDLYGRNKVFLVGLGIFSVSSLVCGLAQTPLQLITARGFQGVGGALLTPGSLSILSSQFGSENRGKAIGLWSTFSALTAVFGPILGGWLASIELWRVIFFINAPLSIVVFISMLLKVPESKNTNVDKLDVWGAILVTLGLAGLSYGLIESPNVGFEHISIRLSLALGVSCLITFVIVQKRIKYPMMPMTLFRSSVFSGGNLLTLFVYASMGGSMFFLPLNLIQVQSYGEVFAGLAMLPIIICIAGISPLMGKFVDKKGVRLPLIIGPMITSSGFLVFSWAGVTSGLSDYWTTFFPALTLMGIGMGVTVAPLTTAVMGAVSPDNTGVASGINNTVARAAGVLAVALMGALALFVFKASLEISIEPLHISASQKKEIMEETINLAAAKIPDTLSNQDRLTVSESIKISFVGAFNRVVYLAAGFTFLGGLMALVFIRKEGD